VIFEEEEERNLMVVLVWSYNLRWKLYDLCKGVAWWHQWWRIKLLSFARERERERRKKEEFLMWCVFVFEGKN